MVQIKSIDNAEQLLIFKEVLQKMSYIEDMKVIGTDINNLELDFLKRRYESLDDYLLEVAQEIGATLPVGFGAALNVVYFPQLGYLLTLPKYCRTSENGNQSAHSSITATSEDTYDSLFGFNLQFTTADNLYYKNARTRADILSNIDCLVSLSVAALKFGYTRPTMTDTSVLKIIKGR
ncbi:hypothetical protein RO3G_01839 [Rhizopus delemar RA 99-880]|uniref:Uncharacterized protein n=1 Tax=Rhizopus delemar (strain RA 99-880 / ATCC MYA-4621 / FGSC 9543 / NRRL 43880) TaxID=246409 RepID=I1BLQ5_RHIO9|nr:hypothetical protein RO3G_01839 [Rhizopus delemar RA 99-880]|eukprot:EIE77135.1 hypothetical protein RO3G_01839 [Rhizopus delemar RA 99-880]